MQRGLSERGAVLPLIAISLAVLMGFAGLSVDVGYWEYQQRQQQSATDAAAVGGAQELAYSSCTDSSAAKTAAQGDAANSGFTNGGFVTVDAENPPSTGPYASSNCAVRVQVTKTNVASFFTKLFGYNSMTETTEAVAQVSSSGAGCIYLLSMSSSSIFNGDTVLAPKCGVLINDTATFNGDPTFEAKYIGYAGSAPVENGTTFTESTPKPMLVTADPCPEITGCAYLTANPPSTSGCVSETYNGLSTLNLPTGCYNSLVINGCGNVVLGSGTYIFNGSTTINGVSSLTGSGVTLYVTSSGTPPTFNGISSVSLSPPTSGNYQGVLYYQSPSNASAPNFNGVSMSMSGLIYAPSSTGVVFNGTSGGYLVIVVGSAIFNGSAAYDLATPGPSGSLIHQAVLAE